MTATIMYHSFRQGTGRSTLIAHAAILLADSGYRVGIVDANFIAPSMHLFFGVTPGRTLNDYMYGQCELPEVVEGAYGEPPGRGVVLLLPASDQPREMMRMTRTSYQQTLLGTAVAEFGEMYQLDFIFLDVHAGLNEEMLIGLSLADMLVIMLRPDEQDYLGTGIIISLAEKLGVEQIALVVNKLPRRFDAASAATAVEQAYGHEVLTVIPYDGRIPLLLSGWQPTPATDQNRNHLITVTTAVPYYQQFATNLLAHHPRQASIYR